MCVYVYIGFKSTSKDLCINENFITILEFLG